MLRQLGTTDLRVFPLCLGCNVFGWTADEAGSVSVLDAYAAAGGNFLDTADVYPPPGTSGGESEAIIGRWLRARGNRDEVVIATKVGRMPGLDDLRPETIFKAVDGSLSRLGIEHIDLYYAHGDDHPELPLDETLAAFESLVESGKIRYYAASNYDPTRLAEALELSRESSSRGFVGLQPEYNMVERAYEEELAPICRAYGLACIPYFSLAWGFLTGKYRPSDVGSEHSLEQSPRRESALRYLNDRGLAVLEALESIAAEHSVPIAAVALSWLSDQPTVVAPIASARNVSQLTDLLPMATTRLSSDELGMLDRASQS